MTPISKTEAVGFEPTDPCGSPVFKTGALSRTMRRFHTRDRTRTCKFLILSQTPIPVRLHGLNTPAGIRIQTDAGLNHMPLPVGLQEQVFQMGGDGFEPSKALPAVLQTAPFGHLGIRPKPLYRESNPDFLIDSQAT